MGKLNAWRQYEENFAVPRSGVRYEFLLSELGEFSFSVSDSEDTDSYKFFSDKIITVYGRTLDDVLRRIRESRDPKIAGLNINRTRDGKCLETVAVYNVDNTMKVDFRPEYPPMERVRIAAG